MKRRKRIIAIVSLLVILISPFIWVCREIRQQTIDQTLILALKTGDNKKAFAALAEGANGEARDMNGPPSFQKALLYLTRHFRYPDVSSSDRANIADHLPPLLVLYHTFYRVNHRQEAGPDPALVKALLEHGAHANDLDEFYTNPLWYASCFANSDAVNFLLAKGADVDSSNFNNETPLMAAVLEGHFDVVRVLLEHGANVSLKEEHGQTALDFVREDMAKYELPSASPKIAAILRKYGAK